MRFGVPGVVKPDPDPEVEKFVGIVVLPVISRGVLPVQHQEPRSFGQRIKGQQPGWVVTGLTVVIRVGLDPFPR